MWQVWKSLLDCGETFIMIKSFIIKFWVTEIVPDEWNIRKLIVLPKKEIYRCQRITEELCYLKLHTKL